VEREIENNLPDRQRMLYPMLLGPTAMSGRFTVDPGRSYLHGRHDPAAAGPTIARAADVAAMRLFKRLPATPSRHP
jgi:hypothetical protein